MKKKLAVLLSAAMLLAGCGSSDSSEETKKEKSTSETEVQEEKAELSAGYYRIKRDTALYDTSGSAVPSGEERILYGTPDQNGGLTVKIPDPNGFNDLGEAQYVYHDYTINDADALTAVSPDEARQAVVDYAVMMSEKPTQTYELSGEFVGENETRSDCSGMTELAYLQIGIYLEHYADSQANDPACDMVFDNIEFIGEVSGIETYRVKDVNARVDISSLEKGDLLFFICATNSSGDNDLYAEDGIGHVAMYIGDGRMVHFTADYGLTNNPCRTEDLEEYQSRVLTVVRAVRYIK